MLKIILLTLISINLFALEISLQGAKEDHQAFSTLHLTDKDKFLCQEIKNEFDITVKIVCAFTNSPSQKLQKIQNSFFEIETKIEKKTFFLIIKPYQKMKLFPMVFDLAKEDTVFTSKVTLSKHWMLIGYNEKIPFINKNTYSDVSINFPFTSTENKLPYVGSLDMQGNPVHVKRVGDVTEYIKIKKLYEDKEYGLCLELINEVMKEYPDSLFTAELLFYKIKVFSKLKHNDKLIEAAKAYLDEYSSDENVAEVLSLLANAYNKVGQGTDADYFFDRLFSEHADSVYAKWGYIYKAEMFESSGSFTNAIALYEKAIRETDDIDVAVEAAYKLAQYFISASNIKEAAKYADKIVKANPKYFAQTMSTSINMMYDFADNEDYASGANIAKAIFDNTDPSDDEYERLSRNVGVWLSKTENKKEALTALNGYLKQFEEGKYAQEVQVAKDSMFFEANDENLSAKLINYDTLMANYGGDSIGNKAIYKKAKLLVENEMYRDALELEEKLLKLDGEEYKDVNKLITDAAIGTMKQSLKEKECNSVLVISSQYKIDLSDEWDDGVYECAMKGADFALAKKIADKNLKSKDLEQRKKWLSRYIKVDFATGNYSNVIEASKELITLIQDDKNSEYRDVYRYLFDTYGRLENSDKMITAIADVEKVYNEDYLDVDRYIAVMSVGSEKKESNLVIEYGKKVMKIQAMSNSHVHSPFVEFTLYQAYIDRENHNEALEVIKSLDSVKLKNSDRARQKYLLGSVYDKLWRDADAKKAYQDAIDAEPASAWAKLAKSAKEI